MISLGSAIKRTLLRLCVVTENNHCSYGAAGKIMIISIVPVQTDHPGKKREKLLRRGLEQLGVGHEYFGSNAKKDSHSKWTGIQCFDNSECMVKRVKASNLDGKTIAGPVALPDVEELVLEGNIKAKLRDFSTMKYLKLLVLLSTEITGSLQDLHGMRELESLTVKGTEVTGSLKDLQGMKNLNHLALHCTQITGSLEDLKRMKKMKRLMLYGTDITGSLQDLQDMQIYHLALYGMSITGSLNELQSMGQMIKLILRSPWIIGSLADLRGMSRMLVLALQSRHINGTIKSLSQM